MKKNVKLAIVIIAVLLVIIIAALAIALPKKSGGAEQTTASESESIAAVETVNKKDKLKFKKTDTLTVKNGADGDVMSVPVDSLKASETENGGVLFYCDDGLGVIKSAVESMTDEENSYKAYIYGGRMRIDKTTKDGRAIVYSVTSSVDEDGKTVYDLSDSRAYFTGENGAYAAFKFPFYYLDEAESIGGLDYGKFGSEFRISVTKTEFMQFYESSGLYIIKDGSNNDFSLEHTYAAVDSGSGYPVKFTFGTDSEGKNTVKIETGTVEQN